MPMHNEREMIIELDKVVKNYPGKVTLAGFSLSIEKGAFVGLLGPNGAGKSTLIRIICGLEQLDGGAIRLFGEPPSHESRSKIGLVPQEYSFQEMLTCFENLMYFASIYGISPSRAAKHAHDLLERMDLADKKNTQGRFLSGGMKRRLNIACALMHHPSILILDEPTVGLDPVTRVMLWNLIRSLVQKENITVILTTHYLEEAESCSHLAFINKGLLIAFGTPDSLKEKAGAQMMRLRSVPGTSSLLEPGLNQIDGIQAVHATESGGFIAELKGESFELSKVYSLCKKANEHIIECSVSRPSLEDVFIRLTGATLSSNEVKKDG